MKITVVLLALLIVASLSSCKDKKVELTGQKVEVIEVVKSEPVAIPPPIVEKPVVKEDNYYLVAGCFDIKSNAEELNSKLLSAGYNSKIIPFYNMSMVTYKGFETRQEAQAALNQIVLDPEKEFIWVFSMK